MNKKTYTTKEVAAMLKVSTGTIKNMIYRGDLDALKLGYRTLRITEVSLNNYFQLNTNN
ncbi:MAG: helix-turn-helix domain-containing protein [Candidatus Marinimicrobia bacterium]|nr:helix-turn-helix domain-containing protein [Candidatus Neomarinimicrobiota bacterium]MBT6757270.1 helix-turn-helix domain-containing protein [Candidatus Jacksonbacteria bacterium]